MGRKSIQYQARGIHHRQNYLVENVMAKRYDSLELHSNCILTFISFDNRYCNGKSELLLKGVDEAESNWESEEILLLPMLIQGFVDNTTGNTNSGAKKGKMVSRDQRRPKKSRSKKSTAAKKKRTMVNYLTQFLQLNSFGVSLVIFLCNVFQKRSIEGFDRGLKPHMIIDGGINSSGSIKYLMIW